VSATPRTVLLLALLLVSVSLHASELSVEPRTVTTNGLVTITVLLEGSFAEMDAPRIPAQNLAIVGEPSVSTEFAWINGDVSRRKTYRYRARPLAAGPARVGPLVLRDSDGRTQMLAAVAIDVTADRAAESNDAQMVLRELLATNRDPLFVVAEVDRDEVYVGEPVVVTWMLYNAVSVQQWRVASLPNLSDFWSEELRRPDEAERVYVGDVMMQRLPVRRVALFPLRSGRLRVEGVTLEAAVMRQRRGGGPFGIFEGELVETSFTSAPFEIDAKPIPPGPPVDAVGDLRLTCDTPQQRNGGPVVVNVTLTGAGNLRGATAPRFERQLEGTVRVEGGAVALPAEEGSLLMTRRWRYLLFPAKSGPLEIPPLSLRTFVPSTGERKELRCEQRILNAVMTSAAAPPPPPQSDAPDAQRIPWWWIAAGVALAAFAALAWPAWLRHRALGREVKQLLGDGAPHGILERIESRLGPRSAVLLAEASDRGDAWRALRSLLVAAVRDRDIAHDAEAEIRRRTRELVAAMRANGR
jgi:hypothetical protein